MGYELTYRNGVLSVRKEPYKRNIRIERTFGEEYSRDMICAKIRNTTPVRVPFPVSKIQAKKYVAKSSVRTKRTMTGIRALYWYYCYLLKIYPKPKVSAKLSKFMQEEVKKMDAISADTRFMVKNNIQTLGEVTTYKDNAVIKVSELKSSRENLWRKYNRTTDEEKKSFILLEVQKLGTEIKVLSNNIKLCKGIEKCSLKANEVVGEVHREMDRQTEKKRDRYVR